VLDLEHEQLWRGGQARHLRPKSFALLRYLVAHPGRVLSKDELVQAVWPETAISDGVLTVSISEIRQALGDAAQAPQYLETVPRRGYRWRGALPTTGPLPAPAASHPAAPRPPLLPIGREAEVMQLHQWIAQARGGMRQVGFVTGEAGIGKTTVVDAFLAQVAQAPDLWLARGQCVESYGASEAYLPVFEALGQLGRGPDGAQLVAELAQQAPTWLVQMPALLAADALQAVQRRVLGATRERMLRELTEALEVLTTERTLVFVLEDLHWSDAATLDLVGALARRRTPARLLLLGTYRPVEVIVRAHPLRALTLDLTLHRQCTELPLQLLSPADVVQYLGRRFGAGLRPAALAQALHQRTDGHPLFLVTVVDALVQQGLMREVDGRWEVPGDLAAVEAVVPESLSQMIAQQFDALPAADQSVLEAASVAGLEHTVAVVAAGVETADEVIEMQCTGLAQRGLFLQAHGVEAWPDGTVTGRYGFRHTLYQQVVYERLPVGRRMRLHRQIGTRLEAGYGAQAGARAAELARHFQRGQDPQRAVQYLGQAADNAAQRQAHHEVIALLTTGLELLAALPNTPARAQQELDLHLALGPALMATMGPGAPEVDQTYARARALCMQVGEPPQLFPTLRGLWRFYLNRGPLLTARELGEQLLRLAQGAAASTSLPEAHAALGTTLFYGGEYVTALTHLEQSFTRTDFTAQRVLGLHHGEAPGVRCLALTAWTLWCLGFPTQALRRGQEALAQAQACAYPYSLAMAQNWMIYVHYRRREVPAVQAQAEALLTLATAQQFPLYAGHVTYWRGWVLALQGQGERGIVQLRQGMAGVLATGQTVVRPLCLLLLAEAMEHTGQVDEGLGVMAEALVAIEASGRYELLAEAYRLHGALLLHQAVSDAHQAEACFQQALAIARRQQAKSWELRAALSLSRLWQQQGKRKEARDLLAPVYGWFTEGFDTADLIEAKALLDVLSESQ
jgi:DNA-binding winged helix-turn-helix (wHTH) protein/predicted ATPase